MTGTASGEGLTVMLFGRGFRPTNRALKSLPRNVLRGGIAMLKLITLFKKSLRNNSRSEEVMPVGASGRVEGRLTSDDVGSAH